MSDATAGCLTAIALFIALFFLRGLAFMLLVSIVHTAWIPAVPTLGYWNATIIAALLSSLIFSGSNTSQKK